METRTTIKEVEKNSKIKCKGDLHIEGNVGEQAKITVKMVP